MTHFADVQQFAGEHAACGGITPGATPRAGGGFMLTLLCACGVTFDRVVTPEEAKRPLPRLPRPGATPPAPSRLAAPRPEAPAVKAAPSPDLQQALREALEAEEATTRAAPASARGPAPPARGPDSLDALVQQALAAEAIAAADAAPAAASGPSPSPAAARRTSPARLNLDSTIRTALTQQAATQLRAPAARRTGTRVVWLTLFALVAFGAAGALYFAVGPDAVADRPAASATAAAPTLDQSQRAALDEVMRSLRQLQTISTPNASLTVYSSRVVFAKSDVERFLAATPPGPTRAAVREVLDVHVLAAAAWKARALEQKELWEPVAQDPAIELCPSVKRVVEFAVPPANVARAQARGAAVASAIPLLWECAGEKLAALERRLAE